MKVLSRAVKDVKKYRSRSVITSMALGITRAVFSLVIAITSRIGIVTWKVWINPFHA
ncbi:hypothetical protein DPMN_059885 [Dreissena polymorpha]|uniref:Uncharacterized protein n=1 Tax=Dreissena polymorpha TaxID=45954 RepID=A0A9D4HFG9_DREPO|nr:hypothetical protein DPMN_059885 [Dreissena polymorpha]